MKPVQHRAGYGVVVTTAVGSRTQRFGLRMVALVGLTGLAALTLPSAASGQWGAEVRGQMGMGGDKLANVQYSDGSDSDLRLGTYFSFTAGPVFEAWRSGARSFELQAMAGWSGWSTGPANTDDRLKLNRFPVEALGFYAQRLPNRDAMLRLGGGVSYHIGGGVSGTGSLSGVDIDLDNAPGGVAEVAFVTSILSGGLRYTHMNISADGLADPLSGSSVSVYLGLTHPRGR